MSSVSVCHHRLEVPVPPFCAWQVEPLPWLRLLSQRAHVNSSAGNAAQPLLLMLWRSYAVVDPDEQLLQSVLKPPNCELLLLIVVSLSTGSALDAVRRPMVCAVLLAVLVLLQLPRIAACVQT